MVRIRNLDEFINKPCKSFFAENGIIAKVFDKEEISSVAGDAIDSIIEEFCAGKAHVSLIISFDLPGKASASISIMEKDSLEQEIAYLPNEGCIDIKITFLMSDEQRASQLEALRAAGIQGSVFKISNDDEYIDYGELDSRCKISLKIKLDEIAQYVWRSEEISFESVATESGKEDGYIHGFMIDLFPDEQGNSEKYFMVGIATPMSLFDDDDVLKNARPFEHNSIDDGIILQTTDDTTPSIQKPEGYDDCIKTGQNMTPEMKEYAKDVNACNTRKMRWQTLFESKNTYLIDCLTKYSQSIADYAKMNLSGNPEIQVKWDNFVKWLSDNNLDEKFFEAFNPELSKKIQDETKFQAASKIAEKIKSEETVQKMVEFRSAMKEFTEKLYDVAHESISSVGGVDEFLKSISTLSDEEIESNQEIKSAVQNIEKLKTDLHINDLVAQLVTLIALDSGFMTEEQAQLPVTEVVELPGYHMVADVLSEVVNVFSNDTAKLMTDVDAIRDIIDPE